jgi:glycosyltransferase involved in cell wall biosynthesis
MISKVLFVSWDGDSVSYMDSLFIPIFKSINQQAPTYNFEIVQFTWAKKEQIELTRGVAKKLGIKYNYRKVHTFPIGILGKVFTLLVGAYYLKRYIKKNNITYLLVRSTIPALMVNIIIGELTDVKIIFDADGLPLEESLEYSSLQESDFEYKFLKGQEKRMIENSDAIITRSKKAIKILQDQHNNKTALFYTVSNGRDTDKFKFNQEERTKIRRELGITEGRFTIIYSGSLGRKYGLEEMIYILTRLIEDGFKFHFIVLTRFIEIAKELIPEDLMADTTIKTVHFDDVPSYLSAADVALALIKPTFSMKAAVPVKLGEYLLTGLPTAASIGIGDTEEILKNIPFTFTLADHSNETLDKCAFWIQNLPKYDRNQIRQFGVRNFSLKKTGESYVKVLDSLR